MGANDPAARRSRLSHLGLNGAQDENRTHDLRITSALLYRLSYLGKDFTLSSRGEGA